MSQGWLCKLRVGSLSRLLPGREADGDPELGWEVQLWCLPRAVDAALTPSAGRSAAAAQVQDFVQENHQTQAWPQTLNGSEMS